MPGAGGNTCAVADAALAPTRTTPAHNSRAPERKLERVTADTGVKTPGSGSWLCGAHPAQQITALLLDALEGLLDLDDVALTGKFELAAEFGDA